MSLAACTVKMERDGEKKRKKENRLGRAVNSSLEPTSVLAACINQHHSILFMSTTRGHSADQQGL